MSLVSTVCTNVKCECYKHDVQTHVHFSGGLAIYLCVCLDTECSLLFLFLLLFFAY